MPKFSDSQRHNLIVIVAKQWHERMARALGQSVEQIDWYDNVYEGLATAIEQQHMGVESRVGVMVDYLSTDEMQLFGQLAALGHIKTTAVSAAGHHRKLARAQSLGAQEILILADQSGKTQPWRPADSPLLEEEARQELSEPQPPADTTPSVQDDAETAQSRTADADWLPDTTEQSVQDSLADLARTALESPPREPSQSDQDEAPDAAKIGTNRTSRKPPGSPEVESVRLSKEEMDALFS